MSKYRKCVHLDNEENTVSKWFLSPRTVGKQLRLEKGVIPVPSSLLPTSSTPLLAPNLIRHRITRAGVLGYGHKAGKILQHRVKNHSSRKEMAVPTKTPGLTFSQSWVLPTAWAYFSQSVTSHPLRSPWTEVLQMKVTPWMKYGRFVFFTLSNIP